jgi:RNA polymerase sigma factor (TIGR02999 family)
MPTMTDVTQILAAIDDGDPLAADRLLPLVYQELRRLAEHHMAREAPGQTLQATALVHEAYLRLVTPPSRSKEQEVRWDSRGHFFAAAAEAMRRILVERARAKATVKRGGRVRRLDFDSLSPPCDDRSQELLALDEALSELERHDPQAAKLVKLRYFAGLSHQDAAAALGIGRRPADRLWAVARAWLYRQIAQE